MSDTPPHPHGVLGDSAWSPPRLVTRSDRPVRADQGNDLAAHEYCDDNDVLIEKVKKLASMLSSSEYCLMYVPSPPSPPPYVVMCQVLWCWIIEIFWNSRLCQ